MGNNSTSFTEKALQAQNRGASYGFLAWLFLEGPDRDFIEQIMMHDEELTADALEGEEGSSAILFGLRQIRSYVVHQPGTSIADLCLELGIQRTRLVRGIDPDYGPPPPYEAVFRCPIDCNESELMLRVQDYYRKAGAQLPPGKRERLDHLGLELDLMHFMCKEESDLWADGFRDAAIEMQQLQRGFLKEHLLVWAPSFCDAALREPKIGFFHGVVAMLKAFLAEEASTLFES